MPNKPITFRRWQVFAAFVILTVSFVIMGVILRDLSRQNEEIIMQNKKQVQRQIQLIQRSRIESCQTTFRIIRDLIDLNTNELRDRQGNLTLRQAEILSKYYQRLNPKRCVTIVQPPKVTKPKPKEK